MSENWLKQYFLDTVDSWLCDDYALDFRYLASRRNDCLVLHAANLGFLPIGHKVDVGFQIQALDMEAGHIQQFAVSKAEALSILKSAVGGRVGLGALELSLVDQGSPEFYSEMTHRDQWFSPLHLQVIGQRSDSNRFDHNFALDAFLRTSNPPFDGVADLISWLALSPDMSGTQGPRINILVSPPLDLLIEKTKLSDGVLRCVIHAHPNFDRRDVGLAVRAVPHADLSSRFQLASNIHWQAAENGICVGQVEVALPNADSALVMLSIGKTTVRRQWFIDPAKARNHRYLSLSQFDPEIRMVRQALFELPDPSKFERAIAAVLYMLGFAPALPIETQAPDIVVSTPTGRMLVVECTLKVADFASKMGKLVDRRMSLAKALTAANVPSQVSALLVCRQPRDQIAATDAELASNGVFLLTIEDVERTLQDVRHLMDPDELLSAGFSKYRQVMPTEAFHR